MFRSTALLFLIGLTACGPNRAFLKEGREAVATQDWERAYRAYDRVLDRKPSHAEALGGRREAQERVLAAVDAELEQAYAAGNLRRVLQALTLAERVHPPLVWMNQRERRWREAWIERLEGQVRDAMSRGAQGERFAYAQALYAFSDEPEHQAAAAGAWMQLREQEWPAMGLRARGPGADAVASGIEQAWSSSEWSDVPLVDRAEGWQLDVRIEERACRTEVVSTRQATHRYQDGTMVPNPRIPELRAELSSAQREHGRAEAERAQLQRVEDRAFSALDLANRDVEVFLPLVDAAHRTVRQAAHVRQDLQAAVSEAEEAVRILNALRTEEDARRSEHSALKRERAQVHAERQGAAERASRLEPRLDRLKGAAAELRGELQQAEQALTQAQEDLAAAKRGVAEARAALEERDVEPGAPSGRPVPIPKLDELVEERRESVRNAEARVKRVKAKLAAAQAAGDDAATTAARTQLESARTSLEERLHQLGEVELELLQARFRKARRVRERTAERVSAAEAQAGSARTRLDQLMPELKQVRGQYQAHVATVQDRDARLSGIDRRLEALRAEGHAAAAERQRLEPLAMDLDARRRGFRRAAERWRVAAAALEDAQHEADRRAAVQAQAAESHDHARASRVEAVRVVEAWLDRQEEIRSDLSREPDLVELVKQAPYTITRHRRTCVISGAITSQSPRAGQQARTLALRTVDEDDTTPARPRIRLQADPLGFGKTDAQVLDELTAQARDAARAQLTGQVKAEAEALRARPRQDKDGGTRDLALAHFMEASPDLRAWIESRYSLPPSR